MRNVVAALSAALMVASVSSVNAQTGQYTFTVTAAEAAKIGRGLDADLRETATLMQKLQGQALAQERAVADAAKPQPVPQLTPNAAAPADAAPTQPKE